MTAKPNPSPPLVPIAPLPLAGCALFLGSALFAGDAAASRTGPAEPFTTWSPTANIAYIWGGNFDPRVANAWGNGLSLNVGWTLGPLLHLGLSYDTFLGERLTTLVSTDAFGTVSDYERASISELFGSVGGDGAVTKDIVVRVFVGVGVADLERVVCVKSVCEDYSGLQGMVSPGATVLRKTRVGTFFAGGRWSLILTDEPTARHGLLFSIGWGYAG